MKRLILMATVWSLCSSVLLFADATTKEKESYLQKTDAKVQEWTAKLKSLEERSEKRGSKSREQLDQKVKVVDEKLAVARKKMDDLRASSEKGWESLRHGLDEALRDVKLALQNAQSFFNKTETKVKKEGI